MPITIGTNISSLKAQRQLSNVTSELSKTFERLSSGLRINRASDDAAGLAIADSLKADSRVLNQGIRNLNDGISMFNIAESAIESLSNIVARIEELASQAANGTYSNTQRNALDAEAQALSKEFIRIANSTTFSGDAGALRAGGDGGSGPFYGNVNRISLSSRIYYGAFGGSGGAGSRDSFGGAGGGSFYVYAKGAIINNGTITANGGSGASGAGGGGGGIIILASKTSVTNAGILSANGGRGGEAADNKSGFGFGGGGGGAGGLVVFASPVIDAPGIEFTSGGSGGISTPLTAASATRIGGGGGGASFGNGGAGGGGPYHFGRKRFCWRCRWLLPDNRRSFCALLRRRRKAYGRPSSNMSSKSN